MFDARIRYFRQSTAIVLFRPLQPSGDCKKLSIYSQHLPIVENPELVTEMEKGLGGCDACYIVRPNSGTGH